MSSRTINPKNYSAYTKIFWGLLVAILDFEINDLDLLPDPVGYLLIVIGCGYLASQAKVFKTARVCAFIMMVWSALLFAISLSDVSLADAYFLYLELFGIVDFLMVWFLLGGIAEIALAKSLALLSNKAKKVRILYGCSLLVVWLLVLLARSALESAPILILLMFILTIAILIIILDVVRTARKFLS